MGDFSIRESLADISLGFAHTCMRIAQALGRMHGLQRLLTPALRASREHG